MPSDPGQIATVLVALAVTDGRPIQISTGKVMSVPPPATELMAPATNADANATRWAGEIKSEVAEHRHGSGRLHEQGRKCNAGGD